MADISVQPFNQKVRIAVLRTSFLLFIPLIFLVHPMTDESLLNEVMEQSGLLLVITGVLGRFWSILYIGGHKNTTVMQSGPYSMCRHPLYLFSTLGAVGFGLMLQSLVLAMLISVVIFMILNLTATREEAFLRSEFGSAYDDYAAQTPRIIPNIPKFNTTSEVIFNVRHLKTNFFDALVFIFLIPLAELIEWVHETGALPAIYLP